MEMNVGRDHGRGADVGFRLRGLEMSRIETFTDAAFAFALTLLVISLEIPSSYEGLVAALNGVPAFAASAVLLMMFWSGHHTWSRRYGLSDATTIILSWLLVFTVLIYVYPLRFVFKVMMAWLDHMVGLPMLSEPVDLGAVGQVNDLFAIYGVGFAAMSAALVLLNWHAWRLRDELELNQVERHDTLVELGAWAIVGSTGLLSVIIAVAVPSSWVGLPAWVYVLLPVLMPVFGTLSGRRRRRLLQAR